MIRMSFFYELNKNILSGKKCQYVFLYELNKNILSDIISAFYLKSINSNLVVRYVKKYVNYILSYNLRTN